MRSSVFLFIFFSLSAAAQDYVKEFAAYQSNFPAEKVYIHFDKDQYKAGETIWFKAYFYQNGMPSALSSNFNLQLLSPEGRVLQNKLYGIGGATTRGHIDLPDSLPAGNYFIQAATPLMTATRPELLYLKSIPVYSPYAPAANESTAAAGDYHIRFFPESGHLVDGILTYVGFHAVDAHNKPVEIVGTIKTPEGVEIPVRTYRNGMGRFLLRPKQGQAYKADVAIGGKNMTVELPAVEAAGLNIHVQDEKGGKQFQLTRSANSKEKFETIDLVVTLNDAVIYDQRISFENYLSVKGHLLTDSLPSGILHFTAFNAAKLPVAERLTFLDNEEYKAKGSILLRSINLAPRQKNAVQVKLDDQSPATLSVSITDAAANHGNTENIYSRILLTSDIKGHVYNAAQYFADKSDSTVTALDNLMMIQGWSRYTWNEILKHPNQAGYYSTYLMQLKGTATDEKSGKPEKGGSVSLLLEDESGETKTYALDVDNNGNFTLDSLFFSGKGKVFYEYHAGNGKAKAANVTVTQLSRPGELQPAPQTALVVFPRAAAKSMIVKKTTALPTDEEVPAEKELEGVVLTSTRKRPSDLVNEKYATGFFQSMGKIVHDNINQPVNNGSQSVVNFIEQSIRTIRLDGQRFVNSKNMTLVTGKNWEVGVLLNESPNNVANIRPIRMSEVALIKFYEAGFPGVSTTTPGGAVAIYLKEGGTEKTDRTQENEKYFEINGYAVVKEFFHPDYSQAQPEEKDTRTTLYWNPALLLSPENPAADINFYNNDVSKKLRIVVEGFDSRGKLIHLEKPVN